MDLKFAVSNFIQIAKRIVIPSINIERIPRIFSKNAKNIMLVLVLAIRNKKIDKKECCKYVSLHIISFLSIGVNAIQNLVLAF